MQTDLGTSAVEGIGWVAEIARHRATSRDIVLICAIEPLRSALVELARVGGYEPYESATPLQAIEALVARGDRIGHALIASDLPHRWGERLAELIAEEYPHVQRYLLTFS